MPTLCEGYEWVTDCNVQVVAPTQKENRCVMAALKDFKERIKNDRAFADAVSGFKSIDEILDFACAQGYDFSSEEIKALTDVSGEEIQKVYGGRNPNGIPVLVKGRIVIDE